MSDIFGVKTLFSYWMCYFGRIAILRVSIFIYVIAFITRKRTHRNDIHVFVEMRNRDIYPTHRLFHILADEHPTSV